MLRVTAITLFMVGLSACAAPHLYEGVERNKKELAYIIENPEEIKLLTIDENEIKPEPGLSGRAYVLPGKHKLVAQYNWVTYMPAGGFMGKVSSSSPNIKEICFIAEAGESYSVRSKPGSGGDWTLYVVGSDSVPCD